MGGERGCDFPMICIVDSGKYKGHIMVTYINGDPNPKSAVARVKELVSYMRITGYGKVKCIKAGCEYSGARWVVSPEMKEYCDEENITVNCAQCSFVPCSQSIKDQ